MKLRPILCTLILAGILFTSQAMAQSAQRLKILGVAVKGNESISENSIKVQAGIMEGKEIIFDDIPEAIKKLWKLKIFSGPALSRAET